MNQPSDHPLFALPQPFADGAAQVNALIFRGLQSVSELQADACALQLVVSSAFGAERMIAREMAGAHGLWAKGAPLNLGAAERSTALAHEIIAMTQQTAAAVTAPVPVPAQRQAVAAAAPRR